MGEEDGLKTLECLRGRLLAERSASRNAKEAADQTENKLVELQAQLKEEIKSRKKAEERLKLLMKKLQSLKISSPSYVFDESYESCSFDKSEVTSVSSSASCSSSKKADDQSLISSNEDHRDNGEDNEGSKDVDYSMALICSDLPKTSEPTRDAVVHDATVKEVLESLRRVAEKIQNSKEQRRMVRVG